MVDRLEILHSVGLIHRDLKPANVCLGLENPEDPSQDKSNTLYLIDYGLTKNETYNKVPIFSKRSYMKENLRLTGTHQSF